MGLGELSLDYYTRKHQPPLILKKGRQSVILGLPLDISLVFFRNSLPDHLCCLTPNTGLIVSVWKCRVPSPCLAWPASGCPWLLGLHVKCRLSAHHLQSISSGASGNFPLPCPLLSPLILFSWDQGYPVSLLSPPVCWSPALLCATPSSEHSLETCLQSAFTTLGLAGIPVLDLGFWTLSQESPVACC